MHCCASLDSRSHHYVGLISKFDTVKGYGFVSCPETFKRFGRDIFIDRESYQAESRDELRFILSVSLQMSERERERERDLLD